MVVIFGFQLARLPTVALLLLPAETLVRPFGSQRRLQLTCLFPAEPAEVGHVTAAVSVLVFGFGLATLAALLRLLADLSQPPLLLWPPHLLEVVGWQKCLECYAWVFPT